MKGSDMNKPPEQSFEGEDALNAALWSVFAAAGLARAVPGSMGSALAQDAAQAADAMLKEAQARGITTMILRHLSKPE